MKDPTLYQWTSNKPIQGLRHFVLLNKIDQNSEKSFQLVSVLDDQIVIEVSSKELKNINYWHPGWLNLSKVESVTKEFNVNKFNRKNLKIFVQEESSFNIS